MPVKIDLDLDRNSYDSQVKHTANHLKENLREPQTYIYQKDGLEDIEVEDIQHMVVECVKHKLVDNLKDLIGNDWREYKHGDLWLAGDSVQIFETVKQDIYNELA